jgi:hypothetical protein
MSARRGPHDSSDVTEYQGYSPPVLSTGLLPLSSRPATATRCRVAPGSRRARSARAGQPLMLQAWPMSIQSCDNRNLPTIAAGAAAGVTIPETGCAGGQWRLAQTPVLQRVCVVAPVHPMRWIAVQRAGVTRRGSVRARDENTP